MERAAFTPSIAFTATVTKEVNVISWNGGTPKYDIRDWTPDHSKMGKGVTLSVEEAVHLLKALQEENLL